ncbi:hypothetical protein H0H93_006191 [Arthromyces matolae]|nr:hypothetical protein H0H93_006191 [Arthromyces matolae]
MYVCQTLQLGELSYVSVRDANTTAGTAAAGERNHDELAPIEMPSSPGLYTPHHRGVGHVPLQVLGWTVDEEYLIRWMDKFAPRSDLAISQKQQWAHLQIPRKLPRGYHKYAAVRDPTPDRPKRRKFCYYITSNKNADKLKLADNMEIVDRFRIALDVQTAPRWYRVSN